MAHLRGTSQPRHSQPHQHIPQRTSPPPNATRPCQVHQPPPHQPRQPRPPLPPTQNHIRLRHNYDNCHQECLRRIQTKQRHHTHLPPPFHNQPILHHPQPSLPMPREIPPTPPRNCANSVLRQMPSASMCPTPPDQTLPQKHARSHKETLRQHTLCPHIRNNIRHCSGTCSSLTQHPHTYNFIPNHRNEPRQPHQPPCQQLGLHTSHSKEITPPDL